MKVFESVMTYLPLLYLYVTSTVLGSVYHARSLTALRPYTVLVFLLANYCVHRFHLRRAIIKTALHARIWGACTAAMFGIIANCAHELLFHEHHFASTHNLGWSLVYICTIWYSAYRKPSEVLLVYCNTAFLLVPINRVWQINLHLYTVFITVSIFLMYSKCERETQADRSLEKLPLLRYFMYLRIHDGLIWVGVAQLYLEYYRRYLPEMQAAHEIAVLLEDAESGVRKQQQELELETQE